MSASTAGPGAASRPPKAAHTASASFREKVAGHVIASGFGASTNAWSSITRGGACTVKAAAATCSHVAAVSQAPAEKLKNRWPCAIAAVWQPPRVRAFCATPAAHLDPAYAAPGTRLP